MKFSEMSVTQRQKWDEANAAQRQAMVDTLELTNVPTESASKFGAGIERFLDSGTAFGGNTYTQEILIPATPTKHGSFEAVMIGDELRFMKSKSLKFFINHVVSCMKNNKEFGVTATTNEDGDSILRANTGAGFNLYQSELDGVMRPCIGTNQYPIVLAQTSDAADLPNGGVV